MLADPVGYVRSVYQRLGWPVPAGLEGQVSDYVAGKPRGSRGAHRYSLADWDLDAAAERERFAFYRDRFSVPEEA